MSQHRRQGKSQERGGHGGLEQSGASRVAVSTSKAGGQAQQTSWTGRDEHVRNCHQSRSLGWGPSGHSEGGG